MDKPIPVNAPVEIDDETREAQRLWIEKGQVPLAYVTRRVQPFSGGIFIGPPGSEEPQSEKPQPVAGK